MIQRYKYKGASFSRTFDTYDHVDCYNFMDIHDHIKYLKCGYTKVTDHACREIRFGRLGRKQAQQLVKQYESQPLMHLQKFCEWLGVEERGLEFILNQHRNHKLWTKTYPGKWQRKPETDDLLQVAALPESGFLGFESHTQLQMDRDDAYITVGKGYP
jgi:hypothetical protein